MSDIIFRTLRRTAFNTITVFETITNALRAEVERDSDAIGAFSVITILLLIIGACVTRLAPGAVGNFFMFVSYLFLVIGGIVNTVTHLCKGEPLLKWGKEFIPGFIIMNAVFMFILFGGYVVTIPITMF